MSEANHSKFTLLFARLSPDSTIGVGENFSREDHTS